MTTISPNISDRISINSWCAARMMLIIGTIFIIGLNQPSPSYAESLAERQTRLAIENQRSFEEWRANIPDYERRLYQRVKRLNDRTVNIMRVISFGFVFTLVFLLVLFWKLRRGVPTLGSVQVATQEFDNPVTVGKSATFDTSISKARLSRIEAKQSKLASLLVQLERGVAAQSEELHAFNQERTDLERTLIDIKKLQNSISNELSNDSKQDEQS